MSKEISIKINVRPFLVPNNVVCEIPPRPRQDGIHDPQNSAIPLSELDAMTLHEMCEEFAKAVFKKAGKQRPPQSSTP